jgi:hypothetical protein
MTAVLNTVIHPAQHAGGIFNGFFMADLAAAWPEISDAGTLIKCGNFERASCPGRVFFEDERDVFPARCWISIPFFLSVFSLAASFSRAVISAG